MAVALTAAQLTGRDDSHLQSLSGGHRLQGEVARAFDALRKDAAADGFELAIASSFRSFGRQLSIFNGKASGARPVHDDSGAPLDVAALPADRRLQAILRFSALPGTSRHHWGTDLDVYDAAAVPAGYRVELSPQEVAPGAVFDPLHRWLDARMAARRSHGFFRPYAVDRGGVAPERWHLSYAPLSRQCAQQCDAKALRAAWDAAPEQLSLRAEIEANLEQILRRYVEVPDDWCEAPR